MSCFVMLLSLFLPLLPALFLLLLLLRVAVRLLSPLFSCPQPFLVCLGFFNLHLISEIFREAC